MKAEQTQVRPEALACTPEQLVWQPATADGKAEG
jgi:hypothetical protein